MNSQPPHNDEFVRISVGGIARDYLLHVPRDLPPQPPVVLMLHGAGGSATWARDETRFNDLADREGFVAAYPEGLAVDPQRPSAFLTNPQVWNAGAGPGLIVNRGPDDVEYLDAVLDDLALRLPFDESRVFLTGFSNGAAMTFRFAAERGNRLTAIAPISGYCPHVHSSVRIVPTLFMIGSEDPLVLVAGGEVRSPWDGHVDHRPPLSHSLARWAAAFGLNDQPRTATDDQGMQIQEYGERPGLFRCVTVPKLGHHWPGGRGRLKRSLAGKPSNLINANDMIWDFFRNATPLQ